MDNWTQIELAEEDRAYEKLIEMVKSYDINDIDPNIIDKINAIGCTSFQCKAVKVDDKVYILPIGGDKPIKIIFESSVDN